MIMFLSVRLFLVCLQGFWAGEGKSKKKKNLSKLFGWHVSNTKAQSVCSMCGTERETKRFEGKRQKVEWMCVDNPGVYR